MNLTQLRALCKENGIRGYSTLRKDGIIALLKNHNVNLPVEANVKKVKKESDTLSTNVLRTEDLGKTAEMAVCLYYDIPYSGDFKYDMKDAIKLMNKLPNLKEIWAPSCTHTASNQGEHDFTYYCNGLTRHLSLKTNKIYGKMVAPHVIGQPTEKTFREKFGLNKSQTIKGYILNNIETMLEKYWNCTYDVPILYYDENIHKFSFFREQKYPNFEKENLSFTRIENWDESTTIKYKGKSIGEFQVHNNRDCIKFRWNHKNLVSSRFVKF